MLVLESLGADLSGWTSLYEARATNSRGTAIVGEGAWSGAGTGGTAWLARLPAGYGCYANCDASYTAPILNVADFVCFFQRFARGEAYANCDGSTVPPVLNVADFTCFLQKFAAGCP